jgi:high-affinity nickel permease
MNFFNFTQTNKKTLSLHPKTIKQMEQLPLLILLAYALYEGLIHAFEADHILAVTNIVSLRERIIPAIKDGIFWGLGHTSTIFLIGLVMIWFQVNIPENTFSYFELAVGLMLILVAFFRLFVFLKDKQASGFVHKHHHEHAGTNKQLHTHLHLRGKHLHKTSYGIGVVHGLAGSGALVILIMTQIRSIAGSLLYLLIFGVGSMIGMALVTGIFSMPFSKKIMDSKRLRTVLVMLSSILCFVYGCYILCENLLILL